MRLRHLLHATALLAACVSGRSPAATSYLPGAAETHGLNNAVFSSTLVLSNVGTAVAGVSIGFIPYEGKAVPAAVSRSLAAGQTLRIEHVLQELFGLGGDAGTLTVTSEAPLALSLTTANVADPAGTFGLALLPAAGATLLSAGQTGHAVWAAQDAAYRTNVALALLDPNSSVDVVVLDEQATVLGRTTVSSAQPVSWQSSLPALTAGPRARASTSVARVELRVSAGRVAGYTAVVDNVTNDGIAVQAQSLTAASVDYVLDGVVRTAGRNGTYFQTDVRLFNPGDDTLTVTMEALGYRTGPKTVTRLLPPAGVVEIRDLLGPDGFDLGDGLAGAVRFRAAVPFLVAGRTNNIDPSGQKPGSFSVYQQPVPYPSALVFPSQRAVVAGVDQTSAFPGFRTNLALFAGPTGTAGRLVLRDAAGAQVAASSFSLDAGSWVQRSSSDWFEGAVVPPGSRIEIEVTSGALDAYAARVDNGTGDGVVLAAQTIPGAAGCGVPAIASFTATPSSGAPGAEVTLTLASSGGAGTSAIVNPGNLAIPLNGSVKVKPSTTATYTATVVGACAPAAVAAARVVVAPPGCAPPRMGLFTATPEVIEPGDPVILKVSSDAAGAAVVVTPGGLQLPSKGFVVVHPTESVRFRAYVASDCAPAGGSAASVSVVPGLPTVLNEVLYDPPGGDAQAVELRVGSGGAPLSQLSLKNDAGDAYALPSSLAQPETGAIVLLVFDGANRVDGATVHADRTGFLNRGGGTLSLRDGEGRTLDAISWGTRAVSPLRYGEPNREPGGTLARLLSTKGSGAEAWTELAPSETSLGRPNPYPGVASVPFAGARLDPGLHEGLTWYPVPGAVGYRFQLASGESFDTPLVDEETRRSRVTLRLEAGEYLFRIQALYPDGAASGWSALYPLLVMSPPSSRATLVGRTVSGVPLLHQRKDTRMVVLESRRESGDAHAWDIPHPEKPDGEWEEEPGCEANCALASQAMINHKFGGNVSQDYLWYSAYARGKPLANGPEYDNNYAFGGVDRSEEGTVLAIALGLGAAVPKVDVIGKPELAWTVIKTEVDAGRPMLAAVQGHAVCLVGYEEFQIGTFAPLRFALAHEPSNTVVQPYVISGYRSGVPSQLQALWPLGERVISSPLRDPLGLLAPEDADKLVDFDKEVRFQAPDGRRLDVAKDDTDGDCVKDKDEVRRSVFDSRRGWGRRWGHQGAVREDTSGTARDADGNGTPPELTKTDQQGDSDGGGVPDIVEDPDRNGVLGPNESDPFDQDDDDVTVEGTFIHLEDETTRGFPNSYESVRTYRRETATLELRSTKDGTMKGKAHVQHDRLVQYHYKTEFSPTGCDYFQNWTSERVEYDNDATGFWACDPDGAVLYISFTKQVPQKIKVSNTCNDAVLDRSDTTFPVGARALFKTDSGDKDTRRVPQPLQKVTGGASVSGSNSDIYDLTLTRNR